MRLQVISYFVVSFILGQPVCILIYLIPTFFIVCLESFSPVSGSSSRNSNSNMLGDQDRSRNSLSPPISPMTELPPARCSASPEESPVPPSFTADDLDACFGLSPSKHSSKVAATKPKKSENNKVRRSRQKQESGDSDGLGGGGGPNPLVGGFVDDLDSGDDENPISSASTLSSSRHDSPSKKSKDKKKKKRDDKEKPKKKKSSKKDDESAMSNDLAEFLGVEPVRVSPGAYEEL